MQEDLFCPHISKVVEKFGFRGVHYDPAREALVFPNSSLMQEDIPEELKGQPAAFFAYIAGNIIVRDENIEVEITPNEALLRIVGSDRYEPAMLLDNAPKMPEVIDNQIKIDGSVGFHRKMINLYDKYVEETGLVSSQPEHLPGDHTPRSPSDYASGRTSSKADIGPGKKA